MISIIICSRNREIPQDLRDNLSVTVGCEYELVFIDNSERKYSLFQAYNDGVRRSKGDILCFMHEDVLFRSEDWGNRIVQYFDEDEKIGVIGFAGSHFLPAAPMYWYSSPFISQRNLNNNQGNVKEHVHEAWFAGRSIIEVVAVDGFCFFVRKCLFEHICFDETTYKGFHLYDMDICMQVIEAGYRVCVCRDVLTEHCWSQKKVFTKDGGDLFMHNLILFTDKWKNKKKLPIWRGLDLPEEMFQRVSRVYRQAYRNDIYSNSSFLRTLKRRIKKMLKR